MNKSKLKLWDEHPSWEAAEAAWERGATAAERQAPIKKLQHIPDMPGITEDTAHNLKWKSLRWMVSQDHNKAILKGFLRHPIKYGWRYITSLFQKVPYKRDGDFFLYGLKSLEEFRKELSDSSSLFVVGFSYCHKPFECPSGRFTDACIHDADNPVCRQCFIGKAVNALPEDNTIPLFIPTVHYIGGKIFELIARHPGKRIIFLITACEMTLQMFGDWGNMVDIHGIGVRLAGRICNTMKAFELSERGIKPGLTVVLDDTQQRMLELLRLRRSNSR